MKNETLLRVAEALLQSQPNQIARLSNASAFLYESFDLINWVGFYLYDGTQLTVGPFQGKVACAEIPLGKGVCGEAALTRKTMVVKDVHAHPNHITCDQNSKSEVVVPIYVNDKLYGVLDVDSPVIDRFNHDIVEFFEDFIKLFVKTIDI